MKVDNGNIAIRCEAILSSYTRDVAVTFPLGSVKIEVSRSEMPDSTLLATERTGH